ILLIVRPAILDRDVFSFDESNVIETLPEGIDKVCEAGSLRASEKSDYRHRRLLRPRRERPRCRRTAEQRDEIATSHSITSSARASSVGGTSRPSALAVLRLIASSNLVGSSTGRSEGLAPLRMRSTKVAARHCMSVRSTP